MTCRVAILQCDEVMEKLQGQFGRYPDMISKMFTGAGNGPFEFTVFDCRKEQYPQEIHTFDLYITTGSKASAYDNQAWISRLIEFIRILDREGKKLVGICFGHQLIAMASGGLVEKSAKGWGVGIATNRVINRPAWMADKRAEINILTSHQDQVTRLPEGALIIAGSDFCPYFVVQWNDHFLGIQGHPEWQREYSRALMNERRSIIAAETIEQGLATLAAKPDNALFVDWIIDFIG